MLGYIISGIIGMMIMSLDNSNKNNEENNYFKSELRELKNERMLKEENF